MGQTGGFFVGPTIAVSVVAKGCVVTRLNEANYWGLRKYRK